MKKIFFMGAALTMALTFTSCKSSESAYKKAYEKAQQAQYGQQNVAQGYAQNGYNVNQGQQNTPVEVTPVTPATTQNTPDYSNVAVRNERVTVVSGGALKAYSVVVGSFSVKANAEGLRTKLVNAGYGARVVRARVKDSDWYRVVAGTFDTKHDAAAFRATQQANYPDAWLLFNN